MESSNAGPYRTYLFRSIYHISICLLLFVLLPLSAENPAQQAWNTWAKKDISVWNYGQGNYSLLGFNPVIDAFLKDPFFIPRFAEDVSTIRGMTLSKALHSAWRATGYSSGRVLPGPCPGYVDVPAEWEEQLGDAARPAYHAWRCFLDVRAQVQGVLSGLSPAEREFIRQHYRNFFFSKESPQTYEFFTTESLNPFIFYALSRKIDLEKLAGQEERLAKIAEYLARHKDAFKALPANYRFEAKSDGAKLLIFGTGNDAVKEDADFIIDAGGDDIYLNNAGGNSKKYPAALLIDMGGDDVYQSYEAASQGGAILGVSLLADLDGNDFYNAQEIAQGAAFFGSGALWDVKGSDVYNLRWYGQGAAAFGTAMLYDLEGSDRYAAQGMAQAAASTSGAAWLIDSRGDDVYRLGDAEKKGWIESMGIGQGGAVGARFYPWLNAPSLYGGIAVLIDGQGDDIYEGAWFSQGSAYFLSAGLLLDRQGNDVYKATVDSQGQGLHLASGLLLDWGGDDIYLADWGSQGTAGDLSAGMLIDGAGNDIYLSGEHNLAVSRKPFALGAVFEGGGDDKYVFKSGSTDITPPETPLEWSKALFVDVSGRDVQSSALGGQRGDLKTWGHKGHSLGIDAQGGAVGDWLLPLPKAPRGIDMAYQSRSWQGAAGAFDKADTSMLPELRQKNYSDARKALETLDLIRFTHSDTHPLVKAIPSHLASVFQNPGEYQPPVLIYTLQAYTMANDRSLQEPVLKALKENRLSGQGVVENALQYLGAAGGKEAAEAAVPYLDSSQPASVQWIAALIVAANAGEKDLEIVKRLLRSPNEEVRYAALRGIAISRPSGWKELVRSLIDDESDYVSKEARKIIQQVNK